MKNTYDKLVDSHYGGDFLESLTHFDSIAENYLREILKYYYSSEKSRNQAWKTCKGSLYEYAVFNYIQKLINEDSDLKKELLVRMGDDVLYIYRDEIVIKNWSDIYPDVDIIIIKRSVNSVVAILSCKTSLRERLTETAFWKREMEKKGNKQIKLTFITTDKDNELRTETNRYILLHVIDATFITDPFKYKELMDNYKKKYGYRDDFHKLQDKIKFIGEIKEFLKTL